MKSLFLIIPLAGLSFCSPGQDGNAVAARAPAVAPILDFKCADMDDVCTNMCYGAFCQGIGVKLTYDKATDAEKRKRRKLAGCIATGGNRCSVKQGFTKGYQCDEYPFASTTSAGSSKRINKCVIAGQNSKQGGALNAFFKKDCGGKACDFSMTFSGATSNFCKSKCTPGDSSIVVGSNTAAVTAADVAGDGTDNSSQDEPTKKVRRGGAVLQRNSPLEYRTSSGAVITVPGGAQIGQRVVSIEPHNATLWDEQALSHVFDPDSEEDEYDYMLPNLHVRESFIVEAISR